MKSKSITQIPICTSQEIQLYANNHNYLKIWLFSVEQLETVLKKNSPTQTFIKFPPHFNHCIQHCWTAEFTLCLLSEDSNFSSVWITHIPPLGLSIYWQRYTDNCIFCNGQDNPSSIKPLLLAVLFKAVFVSYLKFNFPVQWG